MKILCLAIALILGSATLAFAHNVTEGDAGYIQEIWGVHVIPFLYLGAKHMVTGYDHILFLFGVVFFLYRIREGSTLCQPIRRWSFDNDADGGHA